MAVWVSSYWCSVKLHTRLQGSLKMNWIQSRLHIGTCSFIPGVQMVQSGVQICTLGLVGSKTIYSEMALWMQIVFISLVLDKNWNFKSVTWCQPCHKQESAGCLDACNEKPGIFAHPIKTSRISNMSGKLAPSSRLLKVGSDLSRKYPHFSTQSHLKWCHSDTVKRNDPEIFRCHKSSKCSVVLELDYFFWS